MLSLSNLKKSVIIVRSDKSAHSDIYLGIDAELEQVLRSALEKHDVVVKDSTNRKSSYKEKVTEMDNVLSSLQGCPDNTALRCIILMLR